METCVFVRKDKKAFVGYDIENNQLVLNAVGWNRYGVVYRFEYEDESELKTKLDRLNTIVGGDLYEAVQPRIFMVHKKYKHFDHKGSMEDTHPVYPENEEPIFTDTDLMFL